MTNPKFCFPFSIVTTSSSTEELDHFYNFSQLVHPALKYTWEISETSIAFLDIKVSINGNGLSTNVCYKPTDFHSYLLHSSSYFSHVKNSFQFSQFLRLRRLCRDDPDFSNKSEEMRHFFKERGYSDSAVNTAQHPTQQIDRQSVLQTSQRERENSIYTHLPST